MTTSDEIILKPDGSAVRRVVDEVPCNVVDKIIEEMSQNAVRVIKHVGQIDGRAYSLIKTAKELYAVTILPELTINVPWKLSADGLMRPQFDDQSGENPAMALKWPSPPGMFLVFAARIYGAGGAYETRAKDSCYLLALDARFNSYMLPVPNLFETGYMCMGEFRGVDSDVHGAFEKAIRQLHSSKWNSDLYNGGRKAKVAHLMAFKPEGDKFTPVPYSSWTSLLDRCESVTIELLKGGLR